MYRNCSSHNALNAATMDTVQPNANRKTNAANAVNPTQQTDAQTQKYDAPNAVATTQHGTINAQHGLRNADDLMLRLIEHGRISRTCQHYPLGCDKSWSE
jgi:hypothetical protein